MGESLSSRGGWRGGKYGRKKTGGSLARAGVLAESLFEQIISHAVEMMESKFEWNSMMGLNDSNRGHGNGWIVVVKSAFWIHFLLQS